MKCITTTLLAFFIICSCNKKTFKEPAFNSQHINGVVEKMTALMVHDITNPPLASRFFAYACIAGYEVVSQNEPTFKSFHPILHAYPPLKKPDSISGYSVRLAALLAMMETARRMQPSGKLLEAYETHFIDSCKQAGLDEDMINSSLSYATAVSSHVLKYAKSDRYNRISNFNRYTPVPVEGTWYPTPPAYIAAIEPYFNTIRSFTLDTCVQFKPSPPVAFSKDKKSPFYQLMMKNYNYTLTENDQLVASFWDCNPFAVQDNGHLLVGLKKISPGAHWMGITAIACKQANKSFEASMQIFSTVSIGLMDAFICCWDEKFRSNRIRPETAIRKYVDPDWQPFLQTPPFPEYLSGHSVVSACSATILTHFFGDHFRYEDDVETPYGLAPRAFASFNAAANEAALSRFYGGIHFMDAIDNGLITGNEVGNWVLSKTGFPGIHTK